MASTKRLIIGLGNPGPEYEHSRHNVGFMVVDGLAERAGISFEVERGPTAAGCGRYRGRPLCLAKPQTYMNRSGSAVRHQIHRLRISLSDILVVYDDLNLDLGDVRIRRKGSAGGHNGIQNIIDVLGSDNFPRLRIGIGNQFDRGRQAEYVLSPFEEEEIELIQEAIQNAQNAALLFASEGIVAAMNRFNRKK